ARLRRALKLRPGYPEALNGLAGVLLARKQVDEALHTSQQAVALAPNDARLHDTLGTILRALGQHDASIASHERALALNPSVPGTWLNLAGTLQQAGHAHEAAAAYRRALELDPTSSKAHSGLIFMLDLLPDAAAEVHGERKRRDERFGQGWRTAPITHQNTPD